MSELTDAARGFINAGLHVTHPISAKAHIEGLSRIIESQEQHIKDLEERCKPSKVILVGDTGHYVSEAVYKYITELEAEMERNFRKVEVSHTPGKE